MAPAAPSAKYRVVDALQQRLLNPPIRWLLSHGVLPPGYVLLETTGRVSGQPRRTPVGDGRVGDVLWVVAEHGARAGYVRNIRADPRVRVCVRRPGGLRGEWRAGVAEVVTDDDPRARQRALARQRPGTALNSLVVRAMGTELLTVRIRLT
jgi:deazaflavin-dependent oxidoreductase (nitroreductase family)